MDDRAFNQGKVKWLDKGRVGILRNRQDQAIGGLRRWALVLVAVTVGCALSVVVRVGSRGIIMISRG